MDVKYDQHFLVNEKILNEIIESSNINNEDIIFEIGPGKGILTKEILKKNPKKLISVEIDKSFEKVLLDIKNQNLNQNDNFEIIFSNGLEELDNFEFTKLIANIPYSITEPLYKKILDKKIKFALIMHGKNFLDILMRKDNKWNYFVRAFYVVEVIRVINGKNFEPQTKVDSVLVKITPKEKLTDMNRFLQILYSKRTRNVLNALIYSLVDFHTIPKKGAKNIVDKLGIEDLYEKNFENLSNEEFIRIIDSLKGKYVG